uniref:Uncharacterized protein n=1 Tax=Parascaris equorum TaxID=6256 RepID=A0A914S453_PAREQ
MDNYVSGMTPTSGCVLADTIPISGKLLTLLRAPKQIEDGTLSRYCACIPRLRTGFRCTVWKADRVMEHLTELNFPEKL